MDCRAPGRSARQRHQRRPVEQRRHGLGARPHFLPRFHRRRQALSAERDGQPHGRGHRVDVRAFDPLLPGGSEKPRQTRWRRRCPSRCRSSPGSRSIDEFSRSKLTTEYRYHHGYWDGAEREFRGFGMVEQLDTEVLRQVRRRWAAWRRGRRVRRGRPPALLAADADQDLVPPGAGGRRVRRLAGTGLVRRILAGDPPLLEHTEAVNQFLTDLADDSRAAGASSATPCAPCAAASCAPSSTPSTARTAKDRPTPSPNTLWPAQEASLRPQVILRPPAHLLPAPDRRNAPRSGSAATIR